MKLLLCFVLLLSIQSNSLAQIEKSKTPEKITRISNKIQINELNGKPIGFYLNHPLIDLNSKRFYRGELAILEDDLNKYFIDSLFTNNSEIRPFYFFLFNQIVDLSKGKMLEKIATDCLKYVESYPCEFFYAFNQPDFDINVVKWTTYIGQTLNDRNRYAIFRNSVDIRIRENCSDVQDLWKSFLTEVRMCLVR